MRAPGSVAKGAALPCPAIHLCPQHDLFNVFLGGMLGGSIVWGIRAIINEPGAGAC